MDTNHSELVFKVCAQVYVRESVIVLSVFVSAVASATYEKTCVLFSIGAMQTQIASVQDMKADDGLKTAAKLFQVRLAPNE